MYCDQVNNMSSPCWSKRINSLVDQLGCSYFITIFDFNIKYYPIIQQRLYDKYIQKWNACIHNLPKLSLYCTNKIHLNWKNTLLL